MKKVYISGKITGLPMMEVAEKFVKAKAKLLAAGYKHIINPMDLDHSHNHTQSWHEFMRTDLKAMLDCHTIYMMPCWRDSPGAKVELQLAIALNYNIIWGD